MRIISYGCENVLTLLDIVYLVDRYIILLQLFNTPCYKLFALIKLLIYRNSMIIRIFVLAILGSLSGAEDKPNSVKEWKFKLHSGDLIPMVGLGTWQIKGTEIKNSLDYALQAGYRHIDTAQLYENEEDIGRALKELLPKHNLTRHDIFITSKINLTDQNPDGYKSVKDSLQKLQTDYIDLYLIHHPAIMLYSNQLPNGTWTEKFTTGPQNAEVRAKKWQGLVKAQKEGLVRNLGVSNYGVRHLKELLANDYGIKPAVNQIYWNPTNQPRDILKLCREKDMLLIAYSSLGSTDNSIRLRNNPKVEEIAKRLGKSPAQVLLRWPLQEMIAVIPKARSKKHIEENIDLDFLLPDDDVNTLNNFEHMPSWFEFDNID